MTPIAKRYPAFFRKLRTGLYLKMARRRNRQDGFELRLNYHEVKIYNRIRYMFRIRMIKNNILQKIQRGFRDLMIVKINRFDWAIKYRLYTYAEKAIGMKIRHQLQSRYRAAQNNIVYRLRFKYLNKI